MSSTSLTQIEPKPVPVSWIKIPYHRDYHRNSFFSKVRLRGHRTYLKQPQAVMFIEKPLSNIDELAIIKTYDFEYDSENTRRQLNLFAASGIAVGLIIGCTVVAFFALVFALQPNVPTGTIFAYSGSAATLLKNDAQWLFCNGSAVSRTTYSALFLVIGTTYGIGDGIDTFNLPDLRKKFLWGSSEVNNDSFVSGGSETYLLTVSQLPPHNHTKGSLNTVNNGFHTHGVTDPGHDHGDSTGPASYPTFNLFSYQPPYYSTSNAWTYNGVTNHVHSISKDFTYIQIQGDGLHNHAITGETNIVGQGKPIDKMPPYQTVHYIIRI